MKRATAPVVVHRTAWRRLVSMLAGAVPAHLHDLWRGPVETVLLDGAPRRYRSWPVRPIDLQVPPEAMLKQRLTIPTGARGDLESAVELFIAHKTPFVPGELLVHVSEDQDRPGNDHASYTVRAIPRAMIEAGLRDRKISGWRIGRICIAGVPDVDFARALRGKSAFARWSFLVPLAVMLTSLAALAAGDLAARNNRIASFEAEVSASLARVRALSAELDARNRQLAGIGEAKRLLETAPSAYLMLGAIRLRLPVTAEIARIEIRGQDTRLTIRSPDVLAVVQALNVDARANWTASIDGPLTSDPLSGREAAIVLLRGPDA